MSEEIHTHKHAYTQLGVNYYTSVVVGSGLVGSELLYSLNLCYTVDFGGSGEWE